jgi:hypothetical protein
MPGIHVLKRESDQRRGWRNEPRPWRVEMLHRQLISF